MGASVAMLIATYEYQDPGLQQLAAPAHDAESLAAVLGNPAIAGFEVTTLINEPHHQVGAALGDFFRNRRSDDLVLVYFSGHGLKDDDGELYFAMANTRRDSLLFTSLPAVQAHRAMEACPARRQVLVLDCCYSGAFPVGLIPRADPSVHTLERFHGRGRTVLTATDSTQYAFEGNNLQGDAEQSVFTRHLVAGRQDGSADLDHDGDITIEELYDYVHDKVVEEMPRQRPKLQADKEGRLLIARNVHWSLPEYMRHALDSPIAQHRLNALRDLTRLYKNGSPVVRATVQEEIERLAEDDSRMVSAEAAALLASAGAQSALLTPRPPDQPEERAQREAEERAQREAEERAWAGEQPVPPAWLSREEVKTFLRDNSMETFYECPECGAAVKGRNLLSHLDHEHSGRTRGPIVKAGHEFAQAQRAVGQRAADRTRRSADEQARREAEQQAQRKTLREHEWRMQREAEQRVVPGVLTRDEVKALIRDNGMESLYKCQTCGAAIKGKNLVRHWDTGHP